MNLNNILRNTIRKRILDHRFNADEAAAKKAVLAASEALFDALFPGLDLSNIPEEFLSFDDHFDVYWQEVKWTDRIELQFEFTRAVPGDGYNVVVSAMPEGQALRAAYDAKEALKEKRDEAAEQINGILASVRTTDKLLKVWPEIAAFVPQVEKTTNLPALIPAQLNKMLGLPPTISGEEACS